jgi:hypothetical protein
MFCLSVLSRDREYPAKMKKDLMTPLLSALRDICRKYPLTEKVLITPDYRLGREVLQTLPENGVPWVNFRMATASSLAAEVAEKTMKDRGLKRVSGAGIMAIVEDLFYGMADSGQFRYFKKHETNSGMVNALTGVIMELRTKGICPDAIKGEFLTKEDKAHDIKMIFSGYEKKLEEKALIDKAGLTMLAIEALKGFPERKERKYVIFSRYYMSGLERTFIEGFAGENLLVIGDGRVFGAVPPKGLWQPGTSGKNRQREAESGPLAGVYGEGKTKARIERGMLDLFASRGYREEVKEVFRRIARAGRPLDEAEIIYTDRVDYRREIMLFSEKIGTSVTFSEGVPASSTRPFRAVAGFLNWIKNDFLELYLRRVFASGDMKPAELKSDEAFDLTSLGHILKVSGVGWTRQRYEKVLRKKESELLRKAGDPSRDEEADNAEAFTKMAEDVRFLRKICSELLSLIPLPGEDGRVVLGEVCSGIASFLEKYAVARSPNDVDFAEEAVKRCSTIGELGRGRILLAEAADKLLGTFSTINVGASVPRPGCLHVSHYKHGARSARPYTFLVGLDEIKFPGRRSEDPVLLDSERERISRDLEVSSDATRKNIYDMASLLSGIRGKLTASFSMYDIKEERNVFPSPLMLQLFRMKTSLAGSDYEDLMGFIHSSSNSAGEKGEEQPSRGQTGSVKLSPDPDENTTGECLEAEARPVLDDTERWIRLLAYKGGLKDGTEAVRNIYPWLAGGMEAEQARESSDFTEYDGNIGKCGSELDPRRSENLVLSCSKLEKAAACPFKYFLCNVLGVENPVETSKNVTSWLDPMQKGSLLHEVFENFTMEARKRGGSLSESEERSLAEKLLIYTTEKYKEDIPPPNDMVYSWELSGMREDLEVFLRTNRKLGTLPIHEELEFGTNKRPPVKIPLAGGSYFFLRGIIDRLDKVSGHEYHVWDYKTGSAYKYKRRQYLAKGEQLQHVLYAAAAEAILKESKEDECPVVKRSGYILASEKASAEGKGVIFWRDPSFKPLWQEALGVLFDIIALGGFIMLSGDQCSFCEYISICGGENDKKRSSKKRSEDHPVMELLEKLKSYE